MLLGAWLAALFVHESSRSEGAGAVPCITRACEAPHVPVEVCGVTCGHPQHLPVVAAAVPVLLVVGVWLTSQARVRSVFDLRRSSRLSRPPKFA